MRARKNLSRVLTEMVNGSKVEVKGGSAVNPKFFSLPQERQDLIRNSAMVEFGDGTFKKTSADAIAKRAGVSKALLFHYFKDKRELYLYLFQYAIDECMDIFNRHILKASYYTERDFFRTLEIGQQVKMDLVRRHPGLFRFVMRAYYEGDNVLTPKLRKKLDDVLEETTTSFLSRMDLFKFKEGVDPKTLTRLLTLAAEGMLAETRASTPEEIEKLFQQYQKYADMLRQHLYKEEYL